MPFALQRLLAPAMVLPVIVLRLLSSLFIADILKKSLPVFREAFVYYYSLLYITPRLCARSDNKDEGNKIQ
jgi:hypothetical protein